MEFLYTAYILPLLIAGAFSVWVAYYSQSHRSVSGASALALLALAVADWSVAYALEIAGADLSTKVLWAKIQYIGITTVPLLWLVFCYNYFNQGRQLPPRVVGSLLILPLVTLLLVFTTEYHHLIWSRYYIRETSEFSVLGVDHGPWFWIYWVYAYSLLMIGTYFIIRLVRHKHGLYRGQIRALILALIAPWIGNFLYVARIVQLDLTPFGFAVAVAATAWGIFRFQLINLVPLARDTVVEEMEDGIIVIDALNQVVDINRAAATLIGLSVSQAVGKPAVEIFKRWPHLTEKYAKVLDGFDEIAVGEGDAQRWFELGLTSLRNKDNTVVGRLITVRDVTVRKQLYDSAMRELAERKHTELLLQASEERYRQIVENADDLIYRTDVEGRITYVNPISLRVFGVDHTDSILEKNYLEFVAPDWRSRVKRFYVRQFLSGESNTYFEFPILTTDGHELWLGQNVQIIREADLIVGFQAVARDITAIKHAQEALSLARDQAQQASHFKSDLLARVSHELRTPLAGILGYAELLRDDALGPLSPEQKQAAETIVESTDYLSTMISDLMNQAQIEAKKLVLQFGPCSPREMLQGLEEMMSVLAQKRGLTLRTILEPDVPITIYSDAQRLRQILINLAANAVKFTKRGEVCARIFLPDPTHWAMQVADTGIGIQEEAQGTIFEPFWKVNHALTRDNRGIGLGLSITKQLVDLLDGQITLKSKVGEGSTFTVTFPINKIELS